MNADALFRRYQELQTYVTWQEGDAALIAAVGPLVEPLFPALVDDFYAEIQRHPDALKVITGGQEQINRLKGTLILWLKQLVAGNYDSDYVARRWRVGWRHVEIGLDQVYTNVALSRLRAGLMRAVHERWQGDIPTLRETVRALNKLLDLDLAIIEDAYQAEYSERLQRTERLAAIGQVAGGVAHELRNPLNVVKTSVYYLLNARQPNPQKTAEHLQRIERHVTVADNVITALSNFARLPIPALTPFAIESCIRDALEINPVPENIQVTIACPPLKALADKDQIRIVLGNLIRNAREAMAEGGRLTISAGLNKDTVEVAIADTGPGIAKENLGRIMEPLFSTKARGLGLGLAMARAILDKNKGSLKVASSPGQGSTFTVCLSAFVEGQGA
jgi:two-component system, NtrC family, sensor kinase